MGPKITVARKSGQASFFKSVSKLQKMAAYVGVPAEKATRKGDPINNAELLFIQSKGSPVRRIPPRPVLEPAVQADGNREAIASELNACAKATLEGQPAKAEARLRRAAMAGQTAARNWFTDPRNNWVPLAESTKKKRLGKMTKSARKKALAILDAGGDPFTILIDSGALRNAIVGVVRTGGDQSISDQSNVPPENPRSKAADNELAEGIETAGEAAL